MRANNPADLPYGGVCAWTLPPDRRCAALARAELAATMRALRFAPELIDNAQLAVSELATNALVHAHDAGPLQPTAISELAVWARTCPSPELVVTVFDLHRHGRPHPADADPLAEGGRGMAIVEAFTSGWGAHPSRSRLTSPPLAGKAVWMTLPLPEGWPRPARPVSPAVAAQRLTLNLAARGVRALRRSESTGISLVTTPVVNVWVTRTAFCWNGVRGERHHPLIDLQETTERLVETLEQAGCSASG